MFSREGARASSSAHAARTSSAWPSASRYAWSTSASEGAATARREARARRRPVAELAVEARGVELRRRRLRVVERAGAVSSCSAASLADRRALRRPTSGARAARARRAARGGRPRGRARRRRCPTARCGARPARARASRPRRRSRREEPLEELAPVGGVFGRDRARRLARSELDVLRLPVEARAEDRARASRLAPSRGGCRGAASASPRRRASWRSLAASSCRSSSSRQLVRFAAGFEQLDEVVAASSHVGSSSRSARSSPPQRLPVRGPARGGGRARAGAPSVPVTARGRRWPRRAPRRDSALRPPSRRSDEKALLDGRVLGGLLENRLVRLPRDGRSRRASVVRSLEPEPPRVVASEELRGLQLRASLRRLDHFCASRCRRARAWPTRRTSARQAAMATSEDALGRVVEPEPLRALRALAHELGRRATQLRVEQRSRGRGARDRPCSAPDARAEERAWAGSVGLERRLRRSRGPARRRARDRTRRGAERRPRRASPCGEAAATRGGRARRPRRADRAPCCSASSATRRSRTPSWRGSSRVA